MITILFIAFLICLLAFVLVHYFLNKQYDKMIDKTYKQISKKRLEEIKHGK
jgi:septation ring formation regulator EzrA